ncbi:LPS translocon maturation chaperone LptM [Thermomonas flagellata]|uniref:LPS translocon maturation chaperone LptM n=1 Tax=Thermomonas flagellata TaxID=2888524 RepID=UPI001F0373F9|nr:lipoprotein [Thermomonas flagellata]
MTKRLALLTVLACLLAACGNKGPLVRPPPAEPQDAPAPSAPAAEPATGDGAPA